MLVNGTKEIVTLSGDKIPLIPEQKEVVDGKLVVVDPGDPKPLTVARPLLTYWLGQRIRIKSLTL